MPLRDDVMALADDKLMSGHMQSDWTGLGPILEEDIAASAMAQDDLSHAQVLYEWLGGDPDATAFGRQAQAYRCCDLVTLPDEFDWAIATARRFMCAHFATVLLQDFAQSDDADLVDRAARLLKEQAIQTTHLNAWIFRLGTGGTDAHARMQHAFDTLSPYVGGLFETIDQAADRFDRWRAAVDPVLQSAALKIDVTGPESTTCGGRSGQHAEHFILQQAEMTQVRSLEPDAAW
ncbi:MAG: phenylacetate-CoA oxygenase subunit PaaC [Phycisphaerales bacterium]|nr:phenylacetate-CoA oxygenase subunit PaaC [Phycisphaerales bacterium]